MSSSRSTHFSDVHIPLPPPPDEDARAAAFHFRSLLAEAPRPVKLAVLMTLYSWDWAWNETVFTERLAWKMYDVCPPDLKRALDFIVTHKMPVYIADGRELRRHVYFGCGTFADSTQSKGDCEGRNLLSPQEFVASLRKATYDIQASVVKTFHTWTKVKLINEHGSLLKARKLEQLYAAAPDLAKVALNFCLHFEYTQCVNNKEDLDCLTDFERESHEMDHRFGGLRRCDHENITRLWASIVDAVLEDQ